MSPIESFFSVLWLLPLFVLGFLAWRHHHRRAKRRRYTVSSSPSLPLSWSLKRGHAVLEALLVIAFCGVIAAAVLVLFVCADENDLNAIMGL